MAAAEVLAPGSTAASSSDIVVAAATVLCLKGSGNGVMPGVRSEVIVEVKDEDGFYWPIDQLNGSNRLSVVLLAAATYRVTRRAANDAGANPAPAAQFVCGVFTG